MGYHHRVYKQSALCECVAQAEHVFVVGDAEVGAHFVFFDVHGADNDDYLGIVLELCKHFQLAVGLKAGQHAAGVIVVEKFSTKFEVKFVSELAYSFFNVFGLYPQILVIVETVFHNC